MFSICNPTPHEMVSALHPTYHYETPPPVQELSDRLRSMEVSQSRVNKQYNAQSASPTISNNSEQTGHISVKRTKAKLPGHQLVKAYKRLKGK